MAARWQLTRQHGLILGVPQLPQPWPPRDRHLYIGIVRVLPDGAAAPLAPHHNIGVGSLPVASTHRINATTSLMPASIPCTCSLMTCAQAIEHTKYGVRRSHTTCSR